jgi:hypothetical protein
MSNKNSWKWNALAIAAVVAVSAATAAAHEVDLKANVPFAFSINGTKLAPGIYSVTRDGNVWLFRGQDSHQAAGAVNAVRTEGRITEKPALTFNCASERCQLRAIRVGYGASGAELTKPKLSKSDAAELAVVNVPLESAAGE